MSKRFLSLALALALGLVAAACSNPTKATVELGSGTQFVAEVADSLNDAGLYPSVAVTSDGQPYVAYFAFPDDLPEGTAAAPRPIGLPSVPGVMLTTVKDGIWTRGAIAMAAPISNVSVAFDPATDEAVGNLTHRNVTGLQLVADAQGGLHAAWGSSGGLYYGSGSGDPASTTPWTIEQATGFWPVGLSLALDDAGVPWIAYYGSGAAGPAVEVAHKDGSKWVIEDAAPASSCDGCRTAIGVTNGSPVVAFSNGGNVVSTATFDGTQWQSATVDFGGRGLSMAVDGAGNVWLSYYAGRAVKVATGAPGALGVPTIAVDSTGVTPDSPAPGTRTSIAVDDSGTYYLGWTDTQHDSDHPFGEQTIAFGTGTAGEAVTPIETGDTSGGSMPSVAASADGSASFVDWYAGTTADLILGTYGNVQGLGLAVQSPTATGAPTVAPPAATCEKPAADGSVQVVAQGIAFTPETSCFQVAAGTPFTIHFDNQDADTQHNVAIFPSASDLSTVLFRGDLLTGVAQADYPVPALDKGTYFFHCDVHATMTGSVEVK